LREARNAQTRRSQSLRRSRHLGRTRQASARNRQTRPRRRTSQIRRHERELTRGTKAQTTFSSPVYGGAVRRAVGEADGGARAVGFLNHQRIVIVTFLPPLRGKVSPRAERAHLATEGGANQFLRKCNSVMVRNSGPSRR